MINKMVNILKNKVGYMIKFKDEYKNFIIAEKGVGNE